MLWINKQNLVTETDKIRFANWNKAGIKSKYVTLDNKTSLKSLGYICSNSQKYIVWVKIIAFSFITEIVKMLHEDIL